MYNNNKRNREFTSYIYVYDIGFFKAESENLYFLKFVWLMAICVL